MSGSWLGTIPPRPEQVRRLGKQASAVVNYFTQKDGFEYVAHFGEEGLSGGALLFNRWSPTDGMFMGQFIAKYMGPSAPGGSFMADLLVDREFRVLDILRGAEHIVQLAEAGRVKIAGRDSLLMEYVGHGTLKAMVDRFQDRLIPIPNHILWNIFLCSMAHPPRGQQDAAIRREVLPTTPPAQESTAGVVHGDLHFENVCLAGVPTGDREHTFGPLVKFIDFGSASILDENEGVESLSSMPNDSSAVSSYDGDVDEANILAIGELMCSLALCEDVICHPNGRDVTMKGRTINTKAPRELDAPSVAIEDDLRLLIYLCTSADPDDRPSLVDLLEACEYGVATRKAAFYTTMPDKGVYETDEYVLRVLQEVILNAEQDKSVERKRSGRRVSALDPRRRRRTMSIVPRRKTVT
ncbi:Uu.00g061420.m01.CDS01 [Anthostomella pinea]|uniref:Uu.00g061420.m01.CDS01 n=1 Tax=Anthostomella pinea TaxID=933095 RepID=A0AAI8VTL8_9PEZI|nr:Uu.00g061420.m01.CDS01 [Anthostomella pinea]